MMDVRFCFGAKLMGGYDNGMSVGRFRIWEFRFRILKRNCSSFPQSLSIEDSA